MLNPETTYTILLVVQALHLLHHRLTKRHISFAEAISATLLCVPLDIGAPAWALMASHLGLAGVQIAGSVWIRKLSPDWKQNDAAAASSV